MQGSGIKFSCLFILILKLQIYATLESSKNQKVISELKDRYRTSCDQNQDCSNSGVEGSFVPDPQDCQKYYVCLSVNNEIVAWDTSVSCPDGQYFNSDISACEDEIQPCSNTCDGRCSLHCVEETDLIPHPESCFLYQVCLIGGGTETEVCPTERPFFNGADCIADSSSCCDFCALKCVEIGVQIPDPCDCRMYYICVDLEAPPESMHGTCPDGEQFDPTSGICITGNGCTPLCPLENCIRITSTTTETTTTTMGGSNPQ